MQLCEHPDWIFGILTGVKAPASNPTILSQDQVKAWFALLFAHATVTGRMDAVLLEQHKLSFSAFEILCWLLETEPQSIRALSGELVSVSPTRASRLVQDLIDAGHLQRAPTKATDGCRSSASLRADDASLKRPSGVSRSRSRSTSSILSMTTTSPPSRAYGPSSTPRRRRLRWSPRDGYAGRQEPGTLSRRQDPPMSMRNGINQSVDAVDVFSCTVTRCCSSCSKIARSCSTWLPSIWSNRGTASRQPNDQMLHSPG